jgi:hypothetical protein
MAGKSPGQVSILLTQSRLVGHSRARNGENEEKIGGKNQHLQDWKNVDAVENARTE